MDAPVTTYWPEFAQAGKDDMPVRYLLSHQAGLPAVDARLSAEEIRAWDPIAEALAAQAPFWEPGTAHGYHAVSYGYLVGEIVRRISGRSLGTFFRDEIAGPLGIDFYIGLPGDLEHRVSPIVAQPIGAAGAAAAATRPRRPRRLRRHRVRPRTARHSKPARSTWAAASATRCG